MPKMQLDFTTRGRIGDIEVSASVTPNGFADAVHDNKFIMPEVRCETRSLFCNFTFN